MGKVCYCFGKPYTSGKYTIVQLYDPEFMRLKNIHDVEEEKRYWDDSIHKIVPTLQKNEHFER